MASAGIMARNGARRNRNLLASAGITISLNMQLEHVRERLRSSRNPQQIDPVRALARLHPADDLALGQRVVGHHDDQADHDHDGLHEDEQRRGPVGRDPLGQPVANWAPFPHGQITSRARRPSLVLASASDPRPARRPGTEVCRANHPRAGSFGRRRDFAALPAHSAAGAPGQHSGAPQASLSTSRISSQLA